LGFWCSIVVDGGFLVQYIELELNSQVLFFGYGVGGGDR